MELVCGVPQESILGPFKFLFIYATSQTELYHCVDYVIYADDMQIYLPVKLVNPIKAVCKIDACIADLHTWMIKNKLEINDLKTEL